MGAAVRWVVTVAGVGMLAIAGHHALRLGQIETDISLASSEVDRWAAKNTEPTMESWLKVREGLQEAVVRSPGNPAAHELLGVVYALRSSSPDLVEKSLEHFVAAIARRPTSPYTWSNYARASYDLGRTGAPYAAALRAAALLGPGEAEVQETVADLGLATWEETTVDTRQAVDGALQRGMARAPVRLLQIAQRRGRLDAACRHLKAGDARIEKTPQAAACANANTGKTT